MNSMKRILMIMNGNNIGGAELQFIELANYLGAKHQLTLVCLQGEASVRGGRLSNDVDLKVFPYAGGRSAVLPLLKAIRYCRTIKPDAIFTTSFAGDFAGALSRTQPFTKLLSLQTVSADKPHKQVDAFILGQFDFLIAGCTDIEEFLIRNRHSREKIVVINNWVDFSARTISLNSTATRAKYGLGTDELLIGCIGRMHEQKAQEFLIRAFKRAAQKIPRLKLALVGDGPTIDQMKSEADAHPDIVFTGTVTGEDYNNLLGAFDIYVQPSRYEGLPRTLLDAMYMRLPVIVSSANGLKDVICNGENGLIVPAEDAEGLSKAIIRLASDLDLAGRIAKNARQSAMENHSMIAQLHKIEVMI